MTTAIEKFYSTINNHICIHWEEFGKELDTSENRDYSRGFKAGILCATLNLKSELVDIENDLAGS